VRRQLLLRSCWIALLLLAPFALGTPTSVEAAAEDAILDHAIAVTLEPARHHIDVIDEIRLPHAFVEQALTDQGKDATSGALSFRLHAGLVVKALEDSDFSVRARDGKGEQGASESGEEGEGHRLRIRIWDLAFKPEAKRDAKVHVARLSLSGEIHHPLTMESQEYARSFSRTPGTISEAGVFLGGSSWWLPRFGDELVTFTLNVTLPKGWDAVSQGARAASKTSSSDDRRLVVWSCKHPMDEVYLIADRFHEYERAAGGVQALAYLRSDDETLANKYLEVTSQYIEMYRQLIGPYPFSKFAVVENFWETGFGMPSFTLLGPRVIRFPFILHSSYPHEILHNWWGNSVYVDWQTGNWCEGLTAYLADHLIREGQGRGVEYRQDTLKGYRDYVNAGKDFPLTQFRSRHSAATQAVGYGKCLMLFHMLRLQLGDAVFQRGLQAFYRENIWRRAAFADVRTAFASVSGQDLTAFFTQWVERTGAPTLAVKGVTGSPGDLTITLEQKQVGEAYHLRVPIAITIRGRHDAEMQVVEMTQKQQAFPLRIQGEVTRIDVDPQFDVFRRLDRAEIPATLSQMFGAEKVLLILPAAKDAQAAAWRGLVEAWTRGGTDAKVVTADALEALPKDRAVWVLGADNPWKRIFTPTLEAHGAGVDGKVADFGLVTIPRKEHSFVYVAPHPANEDLAVGWLGTDVEAAVPGLARKLPHYGKYSYLGFHGTAPDNVAKGRWPATGSPLMIQMDPKAPVTRGTLPARMPLTRLAPVFDAQRLLGHVRWLADPAREGRGVGTQGLAQAGTWIAAQMRTAGLKPAGDDGTYFQSFTEDGGPDGKPATLRNVVGVLPGTNPKLAATSVVLGAHYDHLGRGWPDQRAGDKGQIYNGADDNASGVSVLLEVARVLAGGAKPARSIVFVAFSGEEWGLKGSQHYVKHMQTYPVAKAFAMVNMDTVGRLEGKKIQVLGSGTAMEWRHVAMGVGFTTGVESNCIAEDPGGSDQMSFVRAGVPAVQIFSGANADYHRPTDDVEKIDADGLVKVATFVREVIAYLGGREKPLTTTLKRVGGEDVGAKPPTRPAGRRVSFGTMPAFDHQGPGVKVADVIEGSPAAKAGVAKGDLLLAIDGKALDTLRTFANVLRRHAPGDKVSVRFKRGTEEKTVEVVLVAR